jgi:hypothetical protein
MNSRSSTVRGFAPSDFEKALRQSCRCAFWVERLHAIFIPNSLFTSFSVSALTMLISHFLKRLIGCSRPCRAA